VTQLWSDADRQFFWANGEHTGIKQAMNIPPKK
jgi:hypothetical protein